MKAILSLTAAAAAAMGFTACAEGPSTNALILASTAPGQGPQDPGSTDAPAEGAATHQTPPPRPVFIEADLPEGFPSPGPAYQVLLKEYPAYRGARADGRNAFRKLFNHIQDRDIAMTAPVEMTLETPDPDTRAQRMDMLFMYAQPDMGQPGVTADQRDVEVVDLPPAQVLSLGFFGRADRGQVNDALTMLRRHLDDRPDLVAVGPARLMGYNSPMVRVRDRYHEVQIPVASTANLVSDSDTPEPEAIEPASAPR